VDGREQIAKGMCGSWDRIAVRAGWKMDHLGVQGSAAIPHEAVQTCGDAHAQRPAHSGLVQQRLHVAGSWRSPLR
jgi:hypothetical protein